MMAGNKRTELLVRAASGVVLLAVVLACAWFSSWTFLLLALTIAIGCLMEFYRMAASGGASPQRVLGIGLAVVLVVSCFLVASGAIAGRWLLSLPVLWLVLPVAELYRRKADPMRNIAVTVTGVLYTALPMALFAFVAFAGGTDGSAPAVYRPWWVLVPIFTVWVNDVGAYLVGSAFGRHPMFPRISPKKSWEGFVGGVFFAVAFALWAGGLLEVSWLWRAGMGACVALGAVGGDLVESLFKRAAGVKDSGSIIPGHGGFLDRFDALLFAVPVLFGYFTIFA